jgi:hypothetical protein
MKKFNLSICLIAARFKYPLKIFLNAQCTKMTFLTLYSFVDLSTNNEYDKNDESFTFIYCKAVKACAHSAHSFS